MKTRQRIQRARQVRRLGKRALYSLVPLVLLLGAAEITLRLAGYQGHPDREVSWCREQGFTSPVFFTAMALDGRPEAYVATSLAAQPRPYPVTKREHERRIFVLGGSSAHGYGFSRNGSFAGRIEELAAEAFPGLDVQVINMGVVAASSQQVLQLGKAILAEQQPDALIVYSGNNELLELWDWRQFLTPRQHRLYVSSLRWNLRLADWRTFLWLRDRLRGDLPTWGETEYTREEMRPWGERDPLTERDRAYARETFRHNMGRLTELSSDAGVPLILSTVTASWTVKPARFELPGHEMPPEVPELHARAEAALQSEPGREGLAEAERLFDEAFDLWPVAHPHWQWGVLIGDADHEEEALAHFLEAVRLDENPNRVPPYINDEIRRLARGSGVTLVDGAAEVAALTPDGIPRSGQVFDHCHPTLESHWILGAAMTEALVGIWPGDASDEAPDPRLVAARRIAALAHPTLDPNRLETYLGMRRVDGAWHYGGDPESAVELRWKDARGEAARHPDDPDAWNRLGVVSHHHQSADCGPDRPCLQDAADAFRRALVLDPDHCAARANLGRLLVQVGWAGEGLQQLQAANRCDPDDAGVATLLDRVRAWPAAAR